MALEDTKYWSMTHNPDTHAIELDWKETSGAMTTDDFKEALEHFAGYIRDQSATGALVDVRRFGFESPPELEPWRQENIVPVYNAGGLKRFAYLLPAGVEYRPGGGGDGAAFVTDYFEDIDEARAWLQQA
jgi:hypothetical protein